MLIQAVALFIVKFLTALAPLQTRKPITGAEKREFGLSSDYKGLRGLALTAAPAVKSPGNRLRQQGSLISPFPVSPPGEGRGGRVPPTPPKAGGSPHIWSPMDVSAGSGRHEPAPPQPLRLQDHLNPVAVLAAGGDVEFRGAEVIDRR